MVRPAWAFAEVEVLWREGGLTLVDGNCVTVRVGWEADEISH